MKNRPIEALIRPYYIVINLAWIAFVINLNACSNSKYDPMDIDWASKEQLLDSLDYLIDSDQGDALALLIDDYGLPKVPLIKENNTSIRWLLLIGKEYYYRKDYVLALDNFDKAYHLIEHFDENVEYDLMFYYLLNINNMPHDVYSRPDILKKHVSDIELMPRNDRIQATLLIKASMQYELLDSFDLASVCLSKAWNHINSANDTFLMLEGKLQGFYIKSYSMSPEESLKYLLGFQELLDYHPNNDNDLISQIKYWNTLGCTYDAIGDYTNTKKVTLKEFECLQKLSDRQRRNMSNFIYGSYSNLADIEEKLGNYESALSYLKTFSQMDMGKARFITKANSCWQTMNILDHLGYPKDSIKSVFYELADGANQMISNKTSQETLAIKESNAQAKKLYEQKASLESKQLSQQRDRAYLVSIILLLSICFALLYRRENKLRVKREHDLVKIKNRLLRGQLTPHFIHNSMHAIMLSIEDSEPRAYKYLSGLDQLLRHTFKAHQKDKILLSKEIDMLKKYVSLEQMRKKDGLLSLDVDVNLNYSTSRLLIAPMLIQPLLENAIKHSRPKEKNQIKIVFEHYQDKLLKCAISDTGEGIAEALTTFPEEHSLYYIDMHTSKLGNGHGLRLEPGPNGIGTTATLLLEYSLSDT